MRSDLNGWFGMGLLIFASVVAGCAGAGELANGTGTVGLKLQTVDPDSGAIYRLPPGSIVALQRTDIVEDFTEAFTLEGDVEVVQLEMPAAPYAGRLRNLGVDGDVWTLERTVGGVTETVQAVLVTPMPVPLVVTADASTPLVFTFQVPDAGPITFGHGSVDVSMEVNGVAATDAEASIHAPVQASSSRASGSRSTHSAPAFR